MEAENLSCQSQHFHPPPIPLNAVRSAPPSVPFGAGCARHRWMRRSRRWSRQGQNIKICDAAQKLERARALSFEEVLEVWCF